MLIEDGYLEKSKVCPNRKCNKKFDGHVPLTCNSCGNRIIPEGIKFKSRAYYPRYLLRISKEKREEIINFLRFSAEFFRDIIKK